MKEQCKDKLILKYIGMDDFSCPVFEDQNGKLWKDINLGKSNPPSLYSVTGNDQDGEPLYPIRQEYSFAEPGPYLRDPFEFEYMMLSRMQSDCNYFLGYGGRSTYALHGQTVDEHISGMKEIWIKLPEDGKPEWLPWEQIQEYEMAMGDDPEKVAEGCLKLKERGVFIL